MPQKRRKTRLQKQAQGPNVPNKFKKLLNVALPVLLIAAIIALVYVVFFPEKNPVNTPSIIISPLTPPKIDRKAQTLDELLGMSPEQLSAVDLAEMNLLCAVGLPGAENLDIDHCLAMLDEWAARVKFETERHLYRAHDSQWAEHYRNSEAVLRAEFLLQVLQQDLGIKYDMTAKDNFDFSDSRVAFLHGMIPASGQTVAETSGGTCVSMPVMYVAVGRRLGYPLKLVTTSGHIFVRWDGRDHPNPAWRERFNIEGAGSGFSSFDDDYYKTWPFELTDYQVRENRYLIPLTPAEELAEFLAARGHCALDNGQMAFAARCYENAHRFDTTRPCYRAWFLDAALQSGYRPATPVLARLLDQRKRPTVARNPAIDMDMPKPSGMSAMPGDVLSVPPVRLDQGGPPRQYSQPVPGFPPNP